MNLQYRTSVLEIDYMKYLLPWRKKVAATLIERRWLLLLMLGAAAFLFEILENIDVGNPLDVHLVREVLFFAGLYPLVTFWLLNDLLVAQAERNSLAWQQKQERQLSYKLGQAQSSSELHETIVAFPELVAPVVGVLLYRPIPESGEMKMVAERWSGQGESPSQAVPTLSRNFCDAVVHLPGRGLHPLLSRPFMTQAAVKGYCLPLFHHDTIIALIHLYLPLAHNLTTDQMSVLNFTAPTMVLFLDTTISQNVASLEAAATRKERERLARHLHDTLGHQLAYLQVKVAQLTADNALMGIQTIQQDLARIRDISNEAYEQVRQTILTMQAESLPELTDALLAQAEVVAQQSNLELRFMVEGEPNPLPPLAHRKILFIVREALNNVQRHAQATILDLCVAWAKDALVINLKDNGAGFDPRLEPDYGHFGLAIMTQRALEIRSELSVSSAPGKGTHICLRYRLAFPQVG